MLGKIKQQNKLTDKETVVHLFVRRFRIRKCDIMLYRKTESFKIFIYYVYGGKSICGKRLCKDSGI